MIGFPCARLNCGNEARYNKAWGLYVCAACGAWYVEKPPSAAEERSAEERVVLPGPYPAIRWSEAR